VLSNSYLCTLVKVNPIRFLLPADLTNSPMSGINICFVFVLVSVASVNAYYTRPFKSMLSLRKARSVQMSSSDVILRQIDDWACIKNCGACCKLGPLDSRPDLEEYLTPEEFSTYKSMIGTGNHKNLK
jgi:hypothetical protein